MPRGEKHLFKLHLEVAINFGRFFRGALNCFGMFCFGKALIWEDKVGMIRG